MQSKHKNLKSFLLFDRCPVSDGPFRSN